MRIFWRHDEDDSDLLNKHGMGFDLCTEAQIRPIEVLRRPVNVEIDHFHRIFAQVPSSRGQQ